MFNYMYRDIVQKGMDVNTSEIISKIKFIGRIQKGEKINVRNMCVQQNNWITRISRTFFTCDDRLNAFHFVENILKRAFEIISLNRSSMKISDRCLVSNMIADIKESLKGVENLKEAYATDIMYCCKLDTLIQDTNSRLTELEIYATSVFSDDKNNID